MTITARVYAEGSRPHCDGCSDWRRYRSEQSGEASLPKVEAPFQVMGAVLYADLCAACAVKLIEALADAIATQDPKVHRELKRFFGD